MRIDTGDRLSPESVKRKFLVTSLPDVKVILCSIYIYCEFTPGVVVLPSKTSVRSWLSLIKPLFTHFVSISAQIDYCLFPCRLFLCFKTLMWFMTTFQPQIQKNKHVWEEEDRMVSLSCGKFQTPAKFSKPLSREDFHKNFSLLSFFKTLPL